jgi:cation transport ATPase
MFNLEAAILEWRRQMRAAGIKTPDHLDELESHLREEIGRQMKAGRSEAEAFQTAVQKIGRAQKVQTEFAKVEASQTSRERKLKEVLLLGCSILMPLMVGRAVLVRGPGTVGMTAGQQWSCLVAMAAFALMIWGGRLGGNRFPVIRARRRRNVINLSGIVLVALWWLVFFRVIVPGRDFTMAQFLVAFIWAFFIPAGVLLGMTLGLETAARSGRGAA